MLRRSAPVWTGYLTAEQPTNDLPDYQSDGISPKHCDDRRGIEAPDYEALHDQSEQPDDDRRREYAEPQAQPGRSGKINGVGAEQDKFAVREIEDAHHAGDDAEAQHDQHHHGTE